MKNSVFRNLFQSLLVILCTTLLFLFLYRMNLSSSRCDVSDLCSLHDLAEQGPVILTGGRLETDENGEVSCRYSFFWEGESALLFFPRSARVSINGDDGALEKAYRGFLFRLEPDTFYDISVSSGSRSFSPTSASVYLGTQLQIIDFISSWTEMTSYFRGLCFAIMLLSVVMLLFKHSERYLLWLALLCFFRGDYGRFRFLLTPFLTIPVLRFLNDGTCYLVLSEMAAALFQYKIMESFVPVKIKRMPFLCYAGAAALPVLLLYRDSVRAALAGMVFFAVLYLCYLICFLRLPAEHIGDRSLLLASWIITVVLRFFDEFCEIGWIPSGDVNLRFRLRGLASLVFVAAFFVLAGKRFAQKFQEADDLNVHLEERIREKTRQQTLFVRSMLHNLKTPLFSLSGYSDMALSCIDRNPAQARQYMEKAREKAIFAGELMDHIFLVTQMDADMVHMQSAPVNLGELLKAVAETPTKGQEGKALTLRLGLPEELYVQGDQLYLRQAFQNILDNARVNTPDGGTVGIRTGLADGGVEVHITDTGCGIAPEEREKIFEAYYSNRHGKQQSSGLGLYISSEIVRRHGGQIRVESTVGEGSDFIVRLPYTDGAEPSEKI